MRRAVSICAAATALALPGVAEAETALIGPPDLGSSTLGAVCQFGGLSPCTRSVLFQMVHEPGVGASAPKDGTVTSWRVRGTRTGAASLSLMTVRPQPNGKFTAINVSSPATALDGTSNPAALPYKAGDQLTVVLTATDPTGSTSINIETSPTAGLGSFSNTFAPGSGEENPVFGSSLKLLFNATVDITPRPAPQDPPASGGEVAKISALSISPSAFEAAGAGGSVIAKVGGRVSYTLDRASAVTFTVSRRSKGRKVGKKCVKPNRRNRGRKSCTRYTKVKGSFTTQGGAGANSFTFSGRLNNRALRKGRYRLEAVATNGAPKSALAMSPFRIKG